jgi:hypothetical protein
MATYTVASGQLAIHAKTLAANAVDTVTFTIGDPHGGAGWANVPKQVEILSDGAADIYVTVDGSAPTVGGQNCYRLPAFAGATVIDVEDADPQDAVLVKMISAGTPEYSVSRAG